MDDSGKGGDNPAARKGAGTGAPPKDVGDYLARVPEEARGVLENLRATIRVAAPRAVESIKYQIPVYKYHLGLAEKLPAYFVWGDVFRAFDMVVSDWWGNREAYENEFLAAERMRDLAAEVVPMLRGAGESLSRIPFPDPGKLKGAEHEEALVSFVDNLADVLRSHTLD